ncbi:MAG TPA: ATP-binding cassette domain-containing protein, partial [Acidimicrobiales bacterium]|nr:ATP-binding cassette domain-containing protein [Acidimicrobiales bacterium]
GRERQIASSLLSEFGVRPCAPEEKAANFSGGNQQKMVLAKWMRAHPRLLLLDEPTQGVDAGAKFEVLQTLSRAASAGTTVLVASGDYEQLSHICHRVLVLRFGTVVAELAGHGLTEAAIARLAQGA